MYQQLIDNHDGKVKTWAVFWYATIYFNKGLCLHPKASLIENIGFDGSGTHCGENATVNRNEETIEGPKTYVNINPIEIKLNTIIEAKILKTISRRKRLRLSFMNRLKSRVSLL